MLLSEQLVLLRESLWVVLRTLSMRPKRLRPIGMCHILRPRVQHRQLRDQLLQHRRLRIDRLLCSGLGKLLVLRNQLRPLRHGMLVVRRELRQRRLCREFRKPDAGGRVTENARARRRPQLAEEDVRRTGKRFRRGKHQRHRNRNGEPGRRNADSSGRVPRRRRLHHRFQASDVVG